MIVSGHQRVRACEELGIETIPCKITHYKDYDEELHRTKEDMILEDLISTNIFQRGIGNVNPMKMALCVQELERIKGVRQGSANKKGSNRIGDRDNLHDQYSQKDLAEDLHISQRQLSDYKKLLNLIPELQDMVKQNELSATVGYKIWARMSSEEQNKFFNDIGREKIKTLTQKATKEYIDKINNLENELENEKRKEPKTIVKEVEKVVDNTDFIDPIMDYYQYIGQKVKVCEGEGCNKRILVKGASPKKYCKECQKEIEKEKIKKNSSKKLFYKI